MDAVASAGVIFYGRISFEAFSALTSRAASLLATTAAASLVGSAYLTGAGAATGTGVETCAGAATGAGTATYETATGT
jgi:hypothetical protein